MASHLYHRTNNLFVCSRNIVKGNNSLSSIVASNGSSAQLSSIVATKRYLQFSSNKNYNQTSPQTILHEEQQPHHVTVHQDNHRDILCDCDHKLPIAVNSKRLNKYIQNSKPIFDLKHHQSAKQQQQQQQQQQQFDLEQENFKRDLLDLTFNDTQNAFKSKTMSELMRSFFVLGLCTSDFLVKNNEQLMKLSKKLLGRRLFNNVMRATFFGQFVAGEDEHSIKPIIDHLSSFGVKSILDYSAEEDINEEEIVLDAISDCNTNTSEQLALRNVVGLKQYQQSTDFVDRRKYGPVARTYFYHGETQCEKNLESFFKSIDAVANSTKQTGLAAVKLTALGRPRLLMKLSKIVECVNQHQLTSLRRQDEPMRPHDGGSSMVETVLNQFESLNQNKINPLAEDEIEMLRNLLRRVNRVAEYARDNGVRFMVDAEQTYMQQAINLITMQLMRQYNRQQAIVFNTYQCYLRSAHDRVRQDLQLARNEGFYFGAKLVRGAYMEQERARAAKLGYPDPINASYEGTTQMYEKTLAYLMGEIVKTDNTIEEQRKICIMVASHNEDTVRFTVNKMKQLNIRPEHRVICFGQLFGMCDHVSFTLGQSGYSVYKYLPYGPVDEVLPYLARRATENHGILHKVERERSLLQKELFERMKQLKLFYKPQGQYKPV